jgi:hypothetical protein
VTVVVDWSRKAWGFPCPACNDSAGCPDCARRRNCRVHFKYLLECDAWMVRLQCPSCGHNWLVDTKCAKASRAGEDGTGRPARAS